MNFIVRLLINAAALYLATRFVDGVSYDGPPAFLLVVALVFGVVNTIVKPILIVLTFPFLIVHAEDDRVVPVESARKLYAAIGSPRKHLKILTAADGGTYHAQADNRQVGVDYIADWVSANRAVSRQKASNASPLVR